MYAPLPRLCLTRGAERGRVHTPHDLDEQKIWGYHPVCKVTPAILHGLGSPLSEETPGRALLVELERVRVTHLIPVNLIPAFRRVLRYAMRRALKMKKVLSGS